MMNANKRRWDEADGGGGGSGDGKHEQPEEVEAEAREPSTDIAQHYNRRAATSTLAARRASPIAHLRNLNNWIKSVLLGHYLRPGSSVFDMCCGRGGDLAKFGAGRVGYVFGADIAAVSVDEAKKRHRERCRFRADFTAVDVFKVDLAADGLFPPGVQFDVTSCQFALHYAFATETAARRMLQNATARLRPGGIFLGTLPNAALLLRKLRASPTLSFGNSVYKVSFDAKADQPARFGERYVFHLEDAIDDLPEYLTDFALLTELAREYGLTLVLRKGFHRFFYDNCAQDAYYPLLERMGVLDDLHPVVGADEWEAAGLYDVFAFQKLVSPPPSALPP